MTRYDTSVATAPATGGDTRLVNDESLGKLAFDLEPACHSRRRPPPGAPNLTTSTIGHLERPQGPP